MLGGDEMKMKDAPGSPWDWVGGVGGCRGKVVMEARRV